MPFVRRTAVASLLVLITSLLVALPPWWAAVLIFGGSPAKVPMYWVFTLAWIPILSAAGVFRFVLYRVWRPGLRPCLCDLPARCYRHRSSPQEHNRPGVVAAKLAARPESEDA